MRQHTRQKRGFWGKRQKRPKNRIVRPTGEITNTGDKDYSGFLLGTFIVVSLLYTLYRFGVI